ncbi:MAG TPA: hypothetical protein ACFYD4_07495 [Candidatus Wunengus sp. YC61]|uniref:hypothetical protein n=1 Tax=Candidatus Wunengus sp. YC61 TaxID=3367698 RepID=UPI004026295B
MFKSQFFHSYIIFIFHFNCFLSPFLPNTAHITINPNKIAQNVIYAAINNFPYNPPMLPPI